MQPADLGNTITDAPWPHCVFTLLKVPQTHTDKKTAAFIFLDMSVAPDFPSQPLQESQTLHQTPVTAVVVFSDPTHPEERRENREEGIEQGEMCAKKHKYKFLSCFKDTR